MDEGYKKPKCKKACFCDEKQAQYYIDKLHKTSNRVLKPVNSYLCEHCLQWHLTSIESKDIKVVKYLERQINNLKAGLIHLKNENERLKSLIK